MAIVDVVVTYIQGRGPLWKIFWIWGVALSWVLFALFMLAAWLAGVNWFVFVITAMVMVPYTAWVIVSVWECSFNVENPVWGWVARALTGFWVMNIGIAGGLLLSRLVLG